MLSCGIWVGMRVLDHIQVFAGHASDAFQMCEDVHAALICESARGVLFYCNSKKKSGACICNKILLPLGRLGNLNHYQWLDSA